MPKKPDTHPESAGDNPVRDEDFRILAEDAPVMLWLTNPEGISVFTNTRWRKFIGAKPGVQISGADWVKSLHPDDRDRCLAQFHDAFAARQPFEMEYRLRRADGQYRWLQDKGEPYIKRDGRFAGFIGTSIDVTDRRNSENQLRLSERELTQHNKEMQLVNEMNSYLQVCRELRETHSIVKHYAQQIFAGGAGALYLFNDTHSILEAVATWGAPETPLETVIAPDDCWALRQSHLHDVTDGKDAIKCGHISCTPAGGYLCVPAIAQGETVGFLHVQMAHAPDAETRKGSTHESSIRLASITADNLAMALVSLNLREALRAQSVRDPLTNLFNRRYMEESLERELARCRREGKPLGVIMIDIDHFKGFNDKFGHEAGDLVLCRIADLAAAKLRKADIACRYGGEELLLILPGASTEITRTRAEEIRVAAEQLALQHRGQTLPAATLSAGVACYPANTENSDELIAAADAALYSAKDTGRNRVVCA